MVGHEDGQPQSKSYEYNGSQSYGFIFQGY